MADTITFQLAVQQVNSTNGTFKSTAAQGATLVQSGYLVADWTQTIGTSEEKIELTTSFGTTGSTWILVKNLDATNYIEIGLSSSTGVYHAKIPAKGCLWLCAHNLPNASSKRYMFAKANTAPVNVQCWIFEA